MKKFKLSSLAVLVAITLGACSSSDDDTEMVDEEETYAKFSLGVSDAPVDSAEAVFIEIDSITLINSDDENETDTTVIDSFTNENDETVETIKVNLLDFQGSSQLKIVDEAQNVELENGTYQMELVVVDSGSYVLLNNDATEHAIKVPSSRLRLGDFTVTDQAVQINDSPAYTVEFDLRSSLVQRGNANNNKGYIIKPHGVRVVSLAGDIAGTVSSDLTNLGECVVYLYSSDVTEYGDMYDSEDEDFVAPEDAITASAPLATTIVAADGTFEFGFVQAENYQVALTCGTEVDDNIQFDGLTIPMAADITPDVETIVVESNQTTSVTFE
jgi:hypothetical protein